MVSEGARFGEAMLSDFPVTSVRRSLRRGNVTRAGLRPETQAEIPEHVGQPVALPADRKGLPGFEAIRKAVADRPESRGDRR